MKNGSKLNKKVTTSFCCMSWAIIKDWFNDYCVYTNLHYLTLLYIVCIHKINLLSLAVYVIFAVWIVQKRKHQHKLAKTNVLFNKFSGHCDYSCPVLKQLGKEI